jgi:hypothetical protein
MKAVSDDDAERRGDLIGAGERRLDGVLQHRREATRGQFLGDLRPKFEGRGDGPAEDHAGAKLHLEQRVRQAQAGDVFIQYLRLVCLRIEALLACSIGQRLPRLGLRIRHDLGRCDQRPFVARDDDTRAGEGVF